MIEQCLQKNPADRPTAKQLLKHDFFKKAKDRSYIAKHLALKFQDRKKMEEKLVNRRKPQSIRAVRLSDSGEWKFSSGSDDEGTSGNDATLGDEAANKLKHLDNPTVKNIAELLEKTELTNKAVGDAHAATELFSHDARLFASASSRINLRMNRHRWPMRTTRLLQ